ncbi:heme peroxidase family protein [Citromicrobium bathyomarinum]|uniref:peroxidase family protein n=1 Tax=Citromicrobium bathyomarinum TaxID=72174 RepID=UPI00315A996B
MLIPTGHGRIVAIDRDGITRSKSNGEYEIMPPKLDQGFVAPGPASEFGYMFRGSGLAEDPDAFDKLERLGAAMISDSGQMMGPSGQPAILTYFGQFIDHDITLNTDTDPASLPDFSVAPDDGKLVLNDRAHVKANIRNGRNPTLSLDSVYGDQSDREELLRDGARMRIGETDQGTPEDLPRFKAVAPDRIDDVDIFASTAFVADGRNDENLIVAQLHLAFLRFHNAVMDHLDAAEPHLDPDQKFARARDLTTLHYQWLVANVYLPGICDRQALETVWQSGAARYRAFVGSGAGQIPFEFSVAAFRFGHSMIRPEYVFNANFGPDGRLGPATLREMFAFTGGENSAFAENAKLPKVWVIDWSNFLVADDDARTARPTDTSLADGLDRLDVMIDALRVLPVRNLRRSYVLNIPTAQSVQAEVDAVPLSDKELRGFGNDLLADLGYLEDTPLWLYILLEAELRAGGKTLGPMGSTLVAEVLIGLLLQDKNSILHRGTGKAASWVPSDAGLGGSPIDSFEKFLRFAGVM